ncbi:hypothetical protein ACOMHN_065678 [Nucella lapillus]
MMMTVVGIYGVCWLPIHLITILGDTNPDIWLNPAMRYVWVSAHWLAMSSCMYNPFIYWWMSDKFRHGYRFLLASIKYRCCKTGRDHLRSNNGWGVPFNNSTFSRGYDFQSRRRSSYAGVGSGGGGGRGGGAREKCTYETIVLKESTNAVRNEVVGRPEGRERQENGLVPHCSLQLDHKETTPLRDCLDRPEDGPDSGDVDLSEEVLPVHV